MQRLCRLSYAYLFRCGSGRPENAIEIRTLVKTRLATVEAYRYAARSAAHFGRLFSVIRACLDDLERGRFVFRPGFACAFCDFRETHCRLWAGA